MSGLFQHFAVRLIVYVFLFCLILFGYIKFLERGGIYFPVKTLDIDLTNVTNATDKAVWSTPQQLKI